MKSFSESYKAAGVDVTAGYESVRLMKEHVARTNTPGCISGIGGFGGLFQIDLVPLHGEAHTAEAKVFVDPIHLDSLLDR